MPDGDLSYLEYAEGGRQRLHFAHATGFNALTYRHLLAPLTETFDIRMWDARGHGQSSLAADPKSQTSWDRYADDLSAFLKAWPGERPPLLCGHSMGGTVSLLTAARHPELICGLILLDPPIYGKEMEPAIMDNPLSIAAKRRRSRFPSKEDIFSAYKGRGAFKTWPDEVLRDYVEGGTREAEDGSIELSCAPEWEAATFRGHLHRSWDAIRALKVPTLLLTATYDSPTRIEDPNDMGKENPNISGHVVEGGTHFFPMESPDLVRGEITAFHAGLVA